MDRIPFYNLLNVLFVGLVGLVCGVFVVPYNLLSGWHLIQELANNTTIEVVIFISIAYLCGLVVNRMGSCLIEGLLKTEAGYDRLPYLVRLFKFPWCKYELYIQARRQDPALKFLTREYVLSRNMVMLFFVLAIVALMCSKYVCMCVFFGCMVLFNISMRKHVFKIIACIAGCPVNGRAPGH